jgi:NADPH-dependent 7-cyano-7-deazaguanine reductase QueF-like protein
MKKTLLSTLLLGSVSVIAQPTLTGLNSNPVFGENVNLAYYNYIAQGNSGASQTWNFAAITPVTAGTVATYTNGAVNSSDLVTFPSANIVQTFTNGQKSFFTTTSSSYQFQGVIAGAQVIDYSNPEDQMRFPMTFGTASYTDAFVAAVDNGAQQFSRIGNSTVVADGYGTIILPGGTYTNVLRVKNTQIYQDSINLAPGFDYIYDYTNTQYLWYLPNNHVPIFTTYNLSYVLNGGAPTVSQGAYKLATIATADVSEITAIHSLSIYPNPINTGEINLDLNLIEDIAYDLIIMNSIGQEVFVSKNELGQFGYNGNKIDVSQLTNGMYTVQIQGNGKTLVSKKLIIQK